MVAVASNRAQDQWKHLYGRRWRKARLNYLTENPLCEYCKQLGYVKQATELDHIVPHKGSAQLFWREDNWQGLCVEHHNATKQKEENIGREIGCDVNGLPNYKGMHW